jgi:phospholipase C
LSFSTTVRAAAATASLCAAFCCASAQASSAVHNAKRTSTGPIQHVVFIVQENRSFNNLFMGYPGALTQSYGYDQSGTKITLHSQSLSQSWDIDHSVYGYYAACDGTGSIPGTNCRNDGWNNESAGGGHPANFAYAYAPHKQVEQYWLMARQYVLADNMFQSNLDGSYISHQYAIAAYANTAVNFPSGSWGCEGGGGDDVNTLNPDRSFGPNINVCFNNETLGDEADAAGVSWRFYSAPESDTGFLWSAYQSNSHIYYGPDWGADVKTPSKQFLTDIAAGNLANITWITPTWANSDHAGSDSSTGPNWVTSVVDAVGESQFWNSTAIFIIWDDWGGWYDPVAPIYTDYDGLGFRIPLIMISPYAKQGYVTHVQYETASVLRFIEDTFGLPQLAAADARANDPAYDAFNYSQSPRAFVPIQIKPERGNQPRSFGRLARPPAEFGD